MVLIVVTNSTCKCCVTYKKKLNALKAVLDGYGCEVCYVDINRHPEIIMGYEGEFRGLPLTIVRDSEGNDLGLLRGDVVEDYLLKRIKDFVQKEAACGSHQEGVCEG